MKRVKAVFYESGSGNMPVREWLLGLDREDRRIIGEDIATVEFSYPIGMPVCRSLGNGLYYSVIFVSLIIFSLVGTLFSVLAIRKIDPLKAIG